MRREPARTADGHTVRAWSEPYGPTVVVCHHPSCCSSDGSDRTKEGIVIAQPPVPGRANEVILAHIAWHDGQAATR